LDKKNINILKKAELLGLAHIDHWNGPGWFRFICLPHVCHVRLLMWPPATCMPCQIADVASSNCPWWY
jgi:hypothetical protein